MIAAPSSYSELRAQVSEALGPCRNPILIHGRDGEGKTSAATWLAWQFGMPAIHLDLFIRRSESKSAISWRTDDLARCLKARGAKPIIIEGVLLLEALATIEKSPDSEDFPSRVPKIRVFTTAAARLNAAVGSRWNWSGGQLLSAAIAEATT
jgi:hypothetical protein